MLHLFYANHTSCLIKALAKHVHQWRHGGGSNGLLPAHILLPNSSMEAYVRLGLARHLGIAAHIKVHFINHFMASLLDEAVPNVQLVDGSVLMGWLLKVIMDEHLMGSPGMEPVRAYVDGDVRDDAANKRRVQFALQMGRLFEEYAYTRADMLDRWRTGPMLQGTPHASTEAWQRALWLLLFGPHGVAEQFKETSGKRMLVLSDLLKEIPALAPHLPPRIFIFGFSYVAQAFHQLFAVLSRHTHVHVYTLNPCMEFWEDVETHRHLHARVRLPRRRTTAQLNLLGASDDPFELLASTDTPALRLWGRPGRENIRLLNQMGEYEWESDFVDPAEGGPTLLRQLQSDILKREAERTTIPASPNLAQDESITFMACPSVRREVEVVAAEIWKLMREDEAHRKADAPPLRFNDVAVIINPADHEAYLPHVAAVFKEYSNIPHSVVDLPVASTSRVVEACQLLLNLPLGNFGRSELLRLVTHPCVVQRFPEDQAEPWMQWCDELGIVHGASHQDHAGTYIDRDVLNWDQGIRRMVLGTFMAGEPSGHRGLFNYNGEDYLPLEIPSGMVESAGHLGLLVRSLIADAHSARDEPRTMEQWAWFLQDMVHSCICATTPEEERDLARCIRVLESLGELDLGSAPVPYSLVHEILVDALGGMTGSRGQHLVQGVVVSSFRPMRAIPFRVVFILGLGEGRFPAPEGRNPLDLRLAKRRAGDVSPREGDRYMFLETLLCAQDRLYLSHVCREQLTGAPLHHCSVVSELLHILARGYVPPSWFKEHVRSYPLRRWDAERAPSHAQLEQEMLACAEVRREHRAWRVHSHLRQSALAAPAMDLASMQRCMRPEVWQRMSGLLGIMRPANPVSIPSSSSATVSLPMVALRRFLECPLQGSARTVLGLVEDESDDPLAREDEPFTTPQIHRTQMLRDVFLESMSTGAPLESCYAARAAREGMHGITPTGMFAQVERRVHVKILEQWEDQLVSTLGNTARKLKVMRYGRADQHSNVDVLHPALPVAVTATFPGAPTSLLLYGKTEPLMQGPEAGSVILAVHTSSSGRHTERTARDALRGWMDHLWMVAAGQHPPDVPWCAHVCVAGSEQAAVHTYAFPSVDASMAMRHLSLLCTDLFSQVHDYLLPCEAVFKWADKGKRGELADYVDELINGTWSSFSSMHGPVRHPEQYRVPDDANNLATRRFAGFLDAFGNQGED